MGDPRRQLRQTLLAAAELHRAGDLAAAEQAYRGVLEIAPDHPDAWHLLGVVAHQRGDHMAAAERIAHAITLQPDTAIFHNNLGAALEQLFRFGEAVEHYERAIALRPDYAEAWKNLGVVLQRQARLPEAARAYRRALELEPGLRAAHSNLLFCLSHLPECSPEQLAAAHREWAARFADPLPPVVDFDDPTEAGRFDPDRPLRVGYVSPDLRHHPVATFLEPLLAAHDRAAVEVVAYASVSRPDEVTERLHTLVDEWHDVRDLRDDQLAHRIAGDRIDILVDLAGHTRDHRLLAFARRPAPVQVTYLGYAATTGLAAIDYRITDRWADPEGATEDLHSEQLVRLPGGFLCYHAPPYAPPLPERARPEAGRVVFGSFNKAAKLPPQVTALWAQLLNELPDSRLVLKSVSFGDDVATNEFHTRFAEAGVAAERIELRPPTPSPADHLAGYADIDIALDPFPYHGATSTCEALWMGAPVVSLAGASHAGRVGVSLLHAVGLDDLVAATLGDYVAIARALAENPKRLHELHTTLRERLADSPLGDAHRLARELEDAYRAMWRRRCTQAAPATMRRSA